MEPMSTSGSSPHRALHDLTALPPAAHCPPLPSPPRRATPTPPPRPQGMWFSASPLATKLALPVVLASVGCTILTGEAAPPPTLPPGLGRRTPPSDRTPSRTPHHQSATAASSAATARPYSYVRFALGNRDTFSSAWR